MTQYEMLIQWLKEAYSMEVQLKEVLEKHADQASDYPNIESKIRKHIDETENHAQLIQRYLDAKGEALPTIGAGAAGLMGMMKGAMDGTAHDSFLKNAVNEYTSEHMEIVTYNALTLAAQQLDETELVEICQQILEDEVRMAEELEAALPSVVEETLRMMDSE